MKKKFPTFAVVLLVLGFVWLLSELKVIQIVNIPWIPVVLVVIALGMLYNHYNN